MFYKWFSNNIKISGLSGFTLLELLTAIVISFVAFWGIMTLYLDIARSHTKDQAIEEIRFNLTMAMDKIAEDVKSADSVNVTITPFSKKINVMDIDPITGQVSSHHYYTAKNDKGILYDDEKLPLPGYYLFEEDGPYGITIEEFELEANLNDYDTPSSRLQDNFYDLTVEFKLFSRINESFERLYTFKQKVFSLNTFATGTGVSDED